MSTAARRAEFFALEAREYLADLDPAATSESPDLERLVRGARALRGAALMAGLGTFARAAAGLEALARQIRDHATPWTPGPRAAWLDGLQTLRDLTERAPAWEAVDDRAALALADRIERATAGGGVKVTVPATPALTPGVRAFIARESAMIAGSLEEAARALAPVPPQAALASVLERMRALRGLGGSAELSPLPELLDAMEMATRTPAANSIISSTRSSRTWAATSRTSGGDSLSWCCSRSIRASRSLLRCRRTVSRNVGLTTIETYGCGSRSTSTAQGNSMRIVVPETAIRLVRSSSRSCSRSKGER